ncbi:unnamed protein product, partial [Rotaria sp. Silwood1]
KSQETQRDSPIKTSCDPRDTDITETFMAEGDGLLCDIHNSSITTREKLVDGRDEYSDISTQKSLTE